MGMKPEPQYDPKWDAQTLAEAAAINVNKTRLDAARRAAVGLEAEAEARLALYKGLSKHIYDHPDSEKAREDRKPNT